MTKEELYHLIDLLEIDTTDTLMGNKRLLSKAQCLVAIEFNTKLTKKLVKKIKRKIK